MNPKKESAQKSTKESGQKSVEERLATLEERLSLYARGVCGFFALLVVCGSAFFGIEFAHLKNQVDDAFKGDAIEQARKGADAAAKDAEKQQAVAKRASEDAVAVLADLNKRRTDYDKSVSDALKDYPTKAAVSKFRKDLYEDLSQMIQKAPAVKTNAYWARLKDDPREPIVLMPDELHEKIVHAINHPDDWP